MIYICIAMIIHDCHLTRQACRYPDALSTWAMQCALRGSTYLRYLLKRQVGELLCSSHCLHGCDTKAHTSGASSKPDQPSLAHTELDYRFVGEEFSRFVQGTIGRISTPSQKLGSVVKSAMLKCSPHSQDKLACAHDVKYRYKYPCSQDVLIFTTAQHPSHIYAAFVSCLEQGASDRFSLV